MSQTLEQIAETLIKATSEEGKKLRKTQVVYAFNGTGKTRLSRVFKEKVDPKDQRTEDYKIKTLYYNAYTEDLFFWDNDLDTDTNRRLLVRPNGFTELALSFLKDENQDGNIIINFQKYTNRFITPNINEDFTEITFDYLGGGDDSAPSIKISKGEESNFIWCVFYSFIEHIVNLLNDNEDDRSTDEFNDLEYIFIDDPVSSLDDNHLIDLAVDLSLLIKKAKPTNVKFIISTHNPLFYNVLFNELNRERNTGRYRLQKLSDGTYLLDETNDSPFSYHIFLIKELGLAADSRIINKYHFNLLRNILEKTSTYLGFNHWEDLINLYVSAEEIHVAIRLINLYSHSKHSGEELAVIQEAEKDIFIKIFKNMLSTHSFEMQIGAHH
ncbi:AAA family ATPase [Myroides odoratimimus]|uniref:AAA family ATPase n=1 Tax=Myroides odoratimimus TaxID=76832 RepID=UPI002578EA18|nr:AAA family ATPase [Myroides odoratimimus]MDM1398827.1 AAA family ATPase [Myroides odoratimimus]